ncbi:hypothetical protein AWM75_00175 [Aerococcus urinaehominis]|uniref:Uncharacterized protein n=1 Tax=Aerococcus urinaehominis TaxID=128944 RepID=A0A109RG33_9LACT|nr:hypothetical protein [Aerococcus urinaehominis]AMB98501.1 hypothetical protein AWM75_00175 [Aerococcus urinaehominis]SDL80516.1 hypothetical protein SAMN04487985_101112 [Aerococcus urinaehominis]
MIYHELKLAPLSEDSRAWLAEITDEDPTFKLRRDFQPEIRPGVWQIYDGYYQINGLYPGISPFIKEYVVVKDGRMTRQVPYRQILAALDEIKAMENQRKDRLRQQISQILDTFYDQAPCQEVEEMIIQQKDEMAMADTSQELLAGLTSLLKQKDQISKRLTQFYQARHQGHDW